MWDRNMTETNQINQQSAVNDNRTELETWRRQQINREAENVARRISLEKLQMALKFLYSQKIRDEDGNMQEKHHGK
jgi:hypothetical protein